ncbi:sensor histidine kinase [Thalassotalea fusca]
MMRHFLNRSRVTFEDRLVQIALLIGTIPFIIMCFLLAYSSVSVHATIVIVMVALITILYGAFLIRHKVVSQLRTSTNLMEAMANGDYSMRANSQVLNGALGEFNGLLNSLSETLNQQRLISKEKQILLHKVIAQIDVAILAVDKHHHLTLMNPAAEQLFNKRFSLIEGMPINQLGLQEVVTKDIKRVVEFEVATSKKKVYLYTDEYFDNGQRNKLIFITDIQRLLLEEERQAWQKLIRVLSHEINNSLAPISSIGESLSHLLTTESAPVTMREDLVDGLNVIVERSQSLEGFIERYQQLSHLPAPEKSLVNLSTLLDSVASLYESAQINIHHFAPIEVFIDKSQIQQVLVNLIKNAFEAMDGESCHTVDIVCTNSKKQVIIEIIDCGTGIFNSDNLFVPYYTTKSQGSGIGLALSRQIIANHGGELTLSNRNDGQQGAVARMTLPIS